MLNKIFRPVDNFLNGITMYRLVLYYLLALLAGAAIFSFLGILAVSSRSLLLGAIFIIAVSAITNYSFSKFFDLPANVESVYITALILVLVITPAKSAADLGFMLWAAVLAMASKYILAINKKHVFNPAAAGLVLASFITGSSASWWVGTLPMLPLVLIGGVLVVRKIVRTELALSFFLAAMTVILVFSLANGRGLLVTAEKALIDSPILFFTFVMITEPLTAPSNRLSRMIYGGLVGLLFAPQIHFGSVYLTPESALALGNIFSYLASPKQRLMPALKERIRLSPDIYDFVFESDEKLNFKPGQYMEWTLPPQGVDNRGNRRYFTIASSPTEGNLRVGIRFSPNSSSFKRSLMSMKPGETIVASQLAGDFVLPKDPSQKLAFIAGGIGVTPFRGMIKYLLDNKEKRDAVLFYSVRSEPDFVYRDIFDQAARDLGMKIVYKVGALDGETIARQAPDYCDRTFYLSGPHGMVTAFESTLADLGVKNIKTDFFPGFA